LASGRQSGLPAPANPDAGAVHQRPDSAARHDIDGPVVGGIYRDGSGRSFVVWQVADDRVRIEYASGAIVALDARNWPLLEPRRARI
jgi:hypothetical protein